LPGKPGTWDFFAPGHENAGMTLLRACYPNIIPLPEGRPEGDPCSWCAAGMSVCLKSLHAVVVLMVHSYVSLLEMGPECSLLDYVGDVVVDP